MKVYERPIIEVKTNEADKGGGEDHGNTRLPFGLCARYGIDLPKGATPRDAWNALKGVGITPDSAYESLRTGNMIELKPESPQVKDAGLEINKITAKEEIETFIKSGRVIPSRVITEERMRTSINAATEEMQATTFSLFNRDSFGFNKEPDSQGCYFSPGFNCVRVSGKWVGGENEAYNTGAPMFHEFWHGIDHNYTPSDPNKISETNKNKLNDLSAVYVLSNGKTMHDILKEENESVDVKAIIVDYIKDKKAYNESRQEWRDKIERSYNEKLSVVRDMQAKRQNTSYNPEWKQAVKDFRAVEMDWIDSHAANPNALKRKWGDLSDFISAKTHGLYSLCGMGHSIGYWMEDKYNAASEAFAEISSSKATGIDSYNLLKKYYPKTVAAYEEIYADIKAGKIIPKNLPAYVR